MKKRSGVTTAVPFRLLQELGGGPPSCQVFHFPLYSPPFVISRSACCFFPGVGRDSTTDAVRGGGSSCTLIALSTSGGGTSVILVDRLKWT